MEKAVNLGCVNGIEIYHIKTDKFKTETISFFIQNQLDEKTVSMNAILPDILKRGSKTYPTLKEISAKLDNMYGASFVSDIMKKGENHIIHFAVDYVCGKYLDEDLFTEAADLLFDILTNPNIDGNKFNEEYLEQEKANLISFIESRINDKTEYAYERCIEEICKGEAFALYEYGDAGIVKNIKNEDLVRHYYDVMKTAKKYIFITGPEYETKLSYLTEKIKKCMGEKSENRCGFDSDVSIRSESSGIKYINDEMDINQGKLCMGFLTNTKPTDDDYMSLFMYNAVLGGSGFVNSKLFLNVRERESLAYYVYSNLEKFKGLMIISCGIDINEKQKAIDVIFEQMEEMKKGNISDFEMDYTKSTVIYSLNAIRDGQMRLTDYYFNQMISGTNKDFDQFIDEIIKVTKEDIIKVSKKIVPEIIY